MICNCIDEFWLQFSKNREQLVNLIFLTILRILSISVAFLITWAIARHYSMKDAGNFFFVYSVGGVLSAVLSLGLNQSIVRFFGENKINRNSNEILSIAITWQFILASIVIVFIYLGSDYLACKVFQKCELQSLIVAQLLAIISFTISTVLGHAFQGIKRPVLTLLFSGLLPNLIFLIALTILLNNDSTTHEIVVVSWTYSVVCFLNIIIAIYCWYSQPKTNFFVKRTISAKLFKSASNNWLSQIGGLILRYGALIIAGSYIGSSEIAKLSISLRVGELLNLLFIPLALVATPLYAELWREQKYPKLKILVKRNVRVMASLGFILVIIMLALDEIILGFFGKEYKEASSVLGIILIGQYLYITIAPNINLLTMTGHEKDAMKCAVLSSIVSLGLSLYLVKKYSLLGAAYSFSISQVIYAFSASVFVRYRLGFWAV